MRLVHLETRRQRARGAALLLLGGLGGLGFALFDAQVLQRMPFLSSPDAERLVPVDVPAVRGTIRDRAGRVVAEDVMVDVLSLLPAQPDSMRLRLDRLARPLGLSARRRAALLRSWRERPAQPLVVATEVTAGQRRALAGEPGVLVERRPVRRYPAGAAAAHVVGWVEEHAGGAGRGQQGGERVGRGGIEDAYDAHLAGRAGVRYLEVDARGRIVDAAGGQLRRAAVRGRDLQVHLDLALQQRIHEVFPGSLHGAVVVLDVPTGEVLALYSHPSFDPTARSDAAGRASGAPASPPERALAMLHAPGPTFDLATAAIALDLGVLEPGARMPIPCRGGLPYGDRYFRCWNRRGHGALDLAEAIVASCDVYFYQVGLKLGLERLLREGARLGFAAATGVDLPGEKPGTFPVEVEPRRRRGAAGVDRAIGSIRSGGTGREGERDPAAVLELAVGGGGNAQTPLGMARFFAALGGNGRAPVPRVVAGQPAPGAGADVELRLGESQLEALRDALRRVTAPGGPGWNPALERRGVIGQTGMARQVDGTEHAWFVGIAGPRGGDGAVVVAVVLEAGGTVAEAARIVAEVADYSLQNRHDVPTDTMKDSTQRQIAQNPARPVPWD